MNWPAVSLATLLCIPVVALASDNTGLAAGRWEEKFTYLSGRLNGKPVSVESWNDEEPTYACIETADAETTARYFFRHMTDGECRPRGQVADGRVALIANCDNAEFGTVTFNGSYSPTSYRALVVAELRDSDGTTVVEAVAEGTYLGACPALESEPERLSAATPRLPISISSEPHR